MYVSKGVLRQRQLFEILLKYEESWDKSSHVGDTVISLSGSKHRAVTSLDGIVDHRETLIAGINRLVVLAMHYLEMNLTCCRRYRTTRRIIHRVVRNYCYYHLTRKANNSYLSINYRDLISELAYFCAVLATETLQTTISCRKIHGIFQAFMTVSDNVDSVFGWRRREDLYWLYVQGDVAHIHIYKVL
jgi:hypothetical protein